MPTSFIYNPPITPLVNRVTAAEGDIDSLEIRVETTEEENDTLRADVTTVQQQQTAQNTAIADLQSTRQTQGQVLALNATQAIANNPIRLLVGGVATLVEQEGEMYTQTTFTINLGQTDFARTRFSKNIAPFASIAPPDESYPGTFYVVTFLGMPGPETPTMNSDGSIKSGAIEVWFHRGFRFVENLTDELNSELTDESGDSLTA